MWICFQVLYQMLRGILKILNRIFDSNYEESDSNYEESDEDY